jgi:hypothetical protein
MHVIEALVGYFNIDGYLLIDKYLNIMLKIDVFEPVINVNKI